MQNINPEEVTVTLRYKSESHEIAAISREKLCFEQGERYDYAEEMRFALLWRVLDNDEEPYGIDLRELVENHGCARERLYDILFPKDALTGNASGSYFCNAWKAERALCGNRDLLEDAAAEFGDDLGELFKQGAESCDIAVRCYLLPQVIDDVFDELRDIFEFNDDEEEEEAGATA